MSHVCDTITNSNEKAILHSNGKKAYAQGEREKRKPSTRIAFNLNNNMSCGDATKAHTVSALRRRQV